MQDSIIKDLSAKFNMPEEQADAIIKNLWLNIKKDLSAGTGRDIMLYRFGSFYKDLSSLYVKHYKTRQFQVRIDSEFREQQETISYDNWLKYIRLWNILQAKIKKYEDMQLAVNKRKNRKKGDRGL